MLKQHTHLNTEAVFSCYSWSAAYWPQRDPKIMWFRDVWDKIHSAKWKCIFLNSATVKMMLLTWRSPAFPDSGSRPRFLSSPDTEKVIHALISSRHDCCKALYSDISRRNNQRLQMIRNAAAGLLTLEQRPHYTTPRGPSLVSCEFDNCFRI